jgi:hypothetical protein
VGGGAVRVLRDRAVRLVEEVDAEVDTKEDAKVDANDSALSAESIDDMDVENDLSAPPEINVVNNFEEMYALQTVAELKSAIRTAALFKPSMKIAILGANMKYVKFESTHDVFGFLKSLDEQEKSKQFKTCESKMSISHINLPSSNSTQKVKDDYASIYQELATTSGDDKSIVNSLIVKNTVTNKDDNASVAHCMLNPHTPMLDFVISEHKPGAGFIVPVSDSSNKLDDSFNLFKCKAIGFDDARKTLYYSGILDLFEGSGCEHLTVINLTDSDDSENKNEFEVIAPELDKMEEEVEEEAAEAEAEAEEEVADKAAEAAENETPKEAIDEAVAEAASTEEELEKEQEQEQEKDKEKEIEEEADEAAEAAEEEEIDLGVEEISNNADEAIDEQNKLSNAVSETIRSSSLSTGGKQTRKKMSKIPSPKKPTKPTKKKVDKEVKKIQPPAKPAVVTPTRKHPTLKIPITRTTLKKKD